MCLIIVSMVLPQFFWRNTWNMYCITSEKSPKFWIPNISGSKDFRQEIMDLGYTESGGQSLFLLRREWEVMGLSKSLEINIIIKNTT